MFGIVAPWDAGGAQVGADAHDLRSEDPRMRPVLFDF
jgi:hypothetical protein